MNCGLLSVGRNGFFFVCVPSGVDVKNSLSIEHQAMLQIFIYTYRFETTAESPFHVEIVLR